MGQRATKFGYYPDSTVLLPGDLVLTRPVKPEFASKAIIYYQKLHWPETAEWTHAAMYLGTRGKIVEATFDNLLKGGSVQVATLGDYISDHFMEFRRIPGIDSESRWLLAINAMTSMRRPYSFSKLFDFVKNRTRSVGYYVKPKKMVCSTLYEKAVSDTLDLIICSGRMVSPAALAETHQLQTIDVGWVKIQHGPDSPPIS